MNIKWPLIGYVPCVVCMKPRLEYKLFRLLTEHLNSNGRFCLCALFEGFTYNWIHKNPRSLIVFKRDAFSSRIEGCTKFSVL